MPRPKRYQSPEEAKEVQKEQIRTIQKRQSSAKKITKEQALASQKLIIKMLNENIYELSEDLIKILEILEQSPYRMIKSIIDENE